VRVNIVLECLETKERLYLTTKNKQNDPERLRLKKYSPKLHHRAVFIESK
jgi:large subunit ribosomal protein L33